MGDITVKKVFGHLKTVLVHKFWVFRYACMLGIPWRGVVHDLSKFSCTEFWESVKYWDGKSSPIPKAKADKGYSLAWQHHKGRNPHHYEYWVDYLDQGGKPIQMPWKCILELVADYCGAGRAYLGKGFTLVGEYSWWIGTRNERIIHEDTKSEITGLLFFLAYEKNKGKDLKKYLKERKIVYELKRK